MNDHLKYPSRFIPDKEVGGYTVVFPDLKGCITEGDSIKEAKLNAQEALSLYLDTLADDNQDFPESSNLKGDDIYYITAKLGESTYTGYHQKSYDKNKDKLLSDKRKKELDLQKQGYKNFREFLHTDTLTKLDKIAKTKNLSRREFITNLIENEFSKLLV